MVPLEVRHAQALEDAHGQQKSLGLEIMHSPKGSYQLNATRPFLLPEQQSELGGRHRELPLLLEEVLAYAREVVLQRLESLERGGANLKCVGSQLGG